MQFKAGGLFDNHKPDRSNKSYKWLKTGRRDIVDNYAQRLESMYKGNKILQRAQKIDIQMRTEKNGDEVIWIFQKLDRLDMEPVQYM